MFTSSHAMSWHVTVDIPTRWSPAATRTMPCLTALRASVAVAYVWFCCWVGVLRCLRCKALFESSFGLPSCPSIYINSHYLYLFLSSVLDCAVHYLLATEVGRLGGCRAILSQKTRHEESASLMGREFLRRFALHLSIGCP